MKNSIKKIKNRISAYIMALVGFALLVVATAIIGFSIKVLWKAFMLGYNTL